MPDNIAITVDDTTETVSLVVTSGTVDSVFGRTGTVVAVAGDYDTDEVTEATNLYYTDARVAANSAVVLNTDKTTNANHTGDATGSGALTLATVNANVGSFTAADITVNAKGLITAAASGSAGGKFIDGTDPLDAVYNDGNVGIGIAAPTKNLHVYGNSNDTVDVLIENNFSGKNATLTLEAGAGADSGVFLGDSTVRAMMAYDGGTNVLFFNNNFSTGPKHLAIDDNGDVGVGMAAPDTRLHVDGAVTQNELSADPSNPAEGSYVQWMSDGTGSGDDGDIIVKITAGGVTKTTTLLDFSTL